MGEGGKERHGDAARNAGKDHGQSSGIRLRARVVKWTGERLCVHQGRGSISGSVPRGSSVSLQGMRRAGGGR